MKTAALLILLLCTAQDKKTGTIQGRISPEVPVKLILKKEQSDHKFPANVKGEVLLPKGGEFKLENIPPGRYDLIFEVQGEERKKWHVNLWSDLSVEAGKTIEGINYRLTPAGSRFMIDEVIVSYKEGSSEAELRKAVAAAGCRIKHRPPKGESGYPFSVDIPDDATADQIVEVFKAIPCVKVVSKNGIGRIESD